VVTNHRHVTGSIVRHGVDPGHEEGDRVRNGTNMVVNRSCGMNDMSGISTILIGKEALCPADRHQRGQSYRQCRAEATDRA
jgi:hypothetical protein